jgi:hypothetical protein
LIEWDARVPALERVLSEAYRAEAIMTLHSRESGRRMTTPVARYLGKRPQPGAVHAARPVALQAARKAS